MHESVFAQLSLIIAIGAGIALIMRLIHQPLIIGHILTGIIVGPTILNLAKSPETIEVFSSIGIALLLFIIGLGLNLRVIKEVGRVAVVAGILEVGITAALGWCAGILLGLDPTASLFLGLALGFSSTIIVLKLLSDKKEQNRLYGKIAIGMLIVEDLVATIILLIVTAQASGGFSPSQLGLLVAKGALITVPLFLISYKVLPRLHRLIAGSQEFLFLFALGWGFGAAALFERFGFSLEIGALIAGVALSPLPYTQEISARLRPLRDFFIVVFFISLGTRLAFGDILPLLPIVIVASIIVIALRPLLILIITGFLGYTKRTSFKAAVSLAQVSEFSLVLVILAERLHMISGDIVTIVTLTALITIAVSAYTITYSDKLFSFFEKQLSLFERRKTHFEQESGHHYELVLFGYQKGGHEFVKVFKALKKRFVVIDYDPEIIDTLEHHKLNFLYGDAMDIELLEEAGLDRSKLIVSTISDHETNLFLIRLLNDINPHAVIILHADSINEAAELYEHGASYVVIPHYIGSEKIGAFIRKSGLKKREFKKYRDRHLAYLQTHYSANSDE